MLAIALLSGTALAAWGWRRRARRAAECAGPPEQVGMHGGLVARRH